MKNFEELENFIKTNINKNTKMGKNKEYYFDQIKENNKKTKEQK